MNFHDLWGERKQKKMAFEAKKDGQSEESAIYVEIEKYSQLQLKLMQVA